MSSIVRQPVYHPVSVVFLDDSPDFIYALRGLFPGAGTDRYFTSAQEALAFVASHEARQSARNPAAGAAWSEFEKKGGNALGEDVMADAARFGDIAALVVDYEMPEMTGIEAIIAIRGEFPNARIVVLTTYTGDVQVLRALKAGARAYLLKGRVNVELLDVIRDVHRGQKRIPPEIAAELAEHATEDDLSQREIDVLRLVATGNGNRDIAANLSITEETVKNHVTHILAKLGANDRTHAVTIGIKRGFIEL